MALETRFAERFAGLDRAHGQWTKSDDTREDGKAKGRAEVVRHEPTKLLWQKHLEGEIGLGIFPLRDDATCSWGAIDIDVYDGLDFKTLEKKINALKLPLIICRSKSGGAHCYLFMSEPVDAGLLRGKLMEWAVALGYSGVEVFPKQIRLANEQDVGNWLNMPYQDGNRSVRYGIDNTKRLSPAAFLDLADARAITAEQLLELMVEVDDLLDGAPPCLQSLARSGTPDGFRNKGLYNFGVFVRMKYGDDEVDKHLDAVNKAYMDPPVGSPEVAKVAKSIKRKNYFYQCNEQPCVAVCNKQICLTRKYGVGTGLDDPGIEIGGIVRLNTDPITWLIEVNSVRLEMSSADLMTQGRFRLIVLEKLSLLMGTVKPPTWAKLVTSRLAEHTEEDAPIDAGPGGTVLLHLQDFCTNYSTAMVRDEILQGKPWDNPEDGKTYFRSADFQKYLQGQRVTGYDGRRLYTMLRSIKGITHGQWGVRGQNVQWWCVDSFPKLEDEADEEIPF